MDTFFTPNCTGASPFTPSRETMSVCMRYIRLAWVLFGMVRSMGKTSERSCEKFFISSMFQRVTNETISPLISMWSE